MTPPKAPGNDHLTGAMFKSIETQQSAAGNYRPISLTSVLRKILERCLLPKMLTAINTLDISQGGFRHHRGALNQAFSLNMLLRQYEKQHNELKTLSSPLFHLVRHMFDDIQTAVIIQNHQSRPDNVVRQ
ncbi:hypothetical protein INT45_001962 [Circinella minor]|uniref:Reverse transcriptase domain-containing protein n=1 Tax=Circinella minor TaxID=1195481 RepID=A0A8H7S995_9FUNG|nr:hypothetical protein INT45_001962 [Circinella minor]